MLSDIRYLLGGQFGKKDGWGRGVVLYMLLRFSIKQKTFTETRSKRSALFIMSHDRDPVGDHTFIVTGYPKKYISIDDDGDEWFGNYHYCLTELGQILTGEEGRMR